MATIRNTSATTPFWASVWRPAVPTGTTGTSWRHDPGRTLTNDGQTINGDPDFTPGYFQFFNKADAGWPMSGAPLNPQAEFWRGRLRSGDLVDVVPETEQVSIVRMDIRQPELDRFKALHSGDAQVQAVTLAELIERSKNRDYRGESAVGVPGASVPRGVVTDCEIAVAGLCIDCVLVVTGAIGIHGKVNPTAVVGVVEAIRPQISAIENIAARLSHAGVSTWEQAMAVKDIVLLIYSGGMIEAIYKAIVGSLSWWDMVLYGTLGMAELTAAFLTDGAALVAVIAAELVQVGFVISDSVKVAQACG